MKSWKRLLLVGWMGLALALPTHAAILVPTESTWRWRPGTSEASDPVTLWRELAFPDPQFTPAPAPFWYGDVLPGGTEISGMQDVYTCIFLRRFFVLTDVAEISGLELRALVDDGFVAWINGTEVLRVNMPAAPGTAVTTATLANNAAEPVAFTTYTLPGPTSYLVAGTNLLAVQVFQSSRSSSDLGFDCALESLVAETIPPTIAGYAPTPGQVTELTQLLVSFSEPVSGVAAAHLLVNGIGALDVTADDSTTYRFTFVQPPYGPVTIDWSPNHNIHDLAVPPNRFDATRPDATWTYELVDRTSPVVSGLTPADGATIRSLTNVIVLFSEPVSGVDAADLLINGSPATGVTPTAASQYVFTFLPPPSGIVNITWAPGHDIQDLAIPSNAFTGGPWTYHLDPNASEAAPYLSEFLASNTRGLADEDRDYPDWIEVYNPSSATVNLDGWYLTDNASQPAKWRFPATNLAGGSFLVVFASGKDLRIPGARLHTNFQLGAGGEYLALLRPDGVSPTSEFAPAFPSQVPDVSYGFAQEGSPPGYTPSAAPLYFTTPSPGAVNLGGSAVPGPVIEAVQHTPAVPLGHEDLLVTARVLPAFRAVGSATLRYRIMFGSELSTPMWDDGAHGDGAAGDGVYGASIPAGLAEPGQMIRYLIAATDVLGNASRWPLFTHPTATAEYLGTLVTPTNLTSQLPVFHLFVAPNQMARIDTESGGRIAFFYDGEFYDNVYMELRGNTSAGLPKKAHRIEFNRGHELRHAGPGGRTRRSSLLAEYLDPAYLRQHLCFWFLDRIGVPAPYNYPVRVQMNGAFYQLAFHSDVIGSEQMERLGYDPAGALYKAVGNLVPSFNSTGVFQKLEPKDDPSRTDYLQLANGIHESSPLAVRRATVFDLLDVPQVINHLAGSRWCAENDDVWANMSLYRDTYGDGLWRCIPFDMNASWGQLYGGSNPLEATVDQSKSHPLYGGSSTEGNFNRLYDVIVTLPETRQMLLRRQRSILDQMVQPPGTPAAGLVIENYVLSMSNRIAAEAALDRAKWGTSPWAPGKTFAQGTTDLLRQFVAPRRQHWYVTHSLTNASRPIGIRNHQNAGIPLTQPPGLTLTLVDIDFNPATGNQDHEYLCLSNTVPYAVDLSGWTLGGAVTFTFAPGTVLPSNSVAYVSPNPRAFRARPSGPRGGQGLFVLGPYQGQLSARGEPLTVANPQGETLGTFRYDGAPSAAQQFLRLTELMFHPAALEGNPLSPDEFEYLEFTNLSPSTPLDLTGVRLTDGVEFQFAGSAFTNLPPGARVLVVKNPIAFAARYGMDLPVAGAFTGNLDNAGERLRLVDASNEEILDFRYEDDWYPLTDGLGFSLVVVDETAAPEAWNQRRQWRPSSALFGSPGAPDPPAPQLPPVLVNEVLTRPDQPPRRDAVELLNPTEEPADVSGWWLSDDLNTPAKFRLPPRSLVPPQGYFTFDESQFNTGNGAFGLGADGDEIWLFSADAAGQLTGYVHGHRFGAAEAGVSFGRHLTSDGQEHFVAQVSTTLGTENAGPRVGPVVFTEIMYHPPDRDGTRNDEDEDEYLELQNLSAQPVPLFDPAAPTNTWRVRGGVDFDLPAAVTLAAGEFSLLVRFDPADATAASAFRSRYGMAPTVRLFGPFTGRLNNAADTVELEKPTSLGDDAVAFVRVDRVAYRDSPPWPTAADGEGAALQRRVPRAYGDDPAHWMAALPTAGASALTDLDGDGLADWWETEHFGGLTADPAADPDADGHTNREEYLAGTDPTDPASYLRLTVLMPSPDAIVGFEAVPGRTYTVEFTNALGVAPWERLATVPARTSRQVVRVSDPSHSGARFYRLLASEPMGSDPYY
jgi:hypothetical protein